MKPILFILMLIVSLMPAVAPAQEPDINGAWYMGGPMNAGQVCRIEQQGMDLTFINEHGNRAAGHFRDTNTVVASGWGNLQGTLADNGTRINWANNTWWTRFPMLQGTWTIAGKTCKIEQKGRELTFINERGERSAGHFRDGITVVASGWGNLQGTLVDNNKRINWANNTAWVR